MKLGFKHAFGAAKGEVTLLVLFIPSVDRDGEEVEQGLWVDKALNMLGACFGGATAFPKAKGVWRDDEQSGKLVFDEPVIIQCYTSFNVTLLKMPLSSIPTSCEISSMNWETRRDKAPSDW